MGVRGKVWRVIKQMYEFSRSPVLLKGRSPIQLVWNRVWHRVVACALYYFLFDLSIEVEKAGLGV